MMNSKKNKDKILVVANDAGGAEIVSSYVKKNQGKSDFICYAYGPAKKVFKRKQISAKSSADNVTAVNRILDANLDIKYLIVGTSGSTFIEINFIKQAKARGIKTIAYLDHWVNYRERFGFPRPNWRKNLPEEIWVGDRYAFNLAKKLFINVPVKLVKNLYFSDMVKEYRRLKNTGKKKGSTILFISESVNKGNIHYDIDLDRNYSLITEYGVLNKLMLEVIANDKYNKLIIRYHPSDDKAKYEHLIAKYNQQLKIEKSKHELVEDLNSASVVVGIESTALAIAYLCGKKVISIPPKRKKSFVLPFNIIKIKKLKDISKYL